MGWRDEVKRRWSRRERVTLDPFWRHPEQRLLVWLAYTLMAGVVAFVSLRLRYGHGVPPQFLGMYAWHTALNFGFCFVVADLALSGLCRWRRWPQTLGMAVLTGFAAFVVGFVLQRTLVFAAIDGYYPELLLKYRRFPSTRPTALRMFIYCLPFWLTVFGGTLWLQLRLQRRYAPAPPADTPDNLLVTTDRGLVRLPLATITHLTMEDHYAHIHLQEATERRRLLVRMTLQQAQSRLPGGSFVQIHRSHLINLQHLRELRKAGRSWEALIGSERQPLPVSRQRLGVLRQYLDEQG